MTQDMTQASVLRYASGDLDPCDGCNQLWRSVEPVELDGREVWLCRSCRELHT